MVETWAVSTFHVFSERERERDMQQSDTRLSEWGLKTETANNWLAATNATLPPKLSVFEKCNNDSIPSCFDNFTISTLLSSLDTLQFLPLSHPPIQSIKLLPFPSVCSHKSKRVTQKVRDREKRRRRRRRN